MKSRITSITVSRLYSTASYEHVRYELEAEVPEGESAAATMLGLERVLAALSPKTATFDHSELRRQRRYVEVMKEHLEKGGADSFRQQYGHFEGTAEEYIARCEESCAKNETARAAWEQQQEKARKMLDDLGGAAKWEDAKLKWEDA